MIDYGRHHVVRLSVCLSVTLCIVALRVKTRRKKRIEDNANVIFFRQSGVH